MLHAGAPQPLTTAPQYSVCGWLMSIFGIDDAVGATSSNCIVNSALQTDLYRLKISPSAFL